MTENPLYRRVYGYDNPLPQYRSIWQPPSDSYVMKKNRYPTAAQDLRNLFGSFFTPNSTPNYAVQYHPSPYQSEPFQTTYNPYSTNNISPAQQEINQRVSDALQSYTPPQPQPSPYQTTMPTYNSYSTNNISSEQQGNNQLVSDILNNYVLSQPRPYKKTYQEPKYSTYNLGTPQANYYAESKPEARNAMYNFAINQGIPMFLTGVTTGGLGYGLGSMARPYIPYALARLGATHYGKPIANGLSKFVETPVGKFVGKIADFIF